MKLFVVVLIAAALMSVLAYEPFPSPTFGLTLAQSKAALNAALAKAVSTYPTVGFSIVTVDAAANMKAFVRQDGASPISVEVAYQKAKTSIYLLLNTSFFGETQIATPAGGFYNFEATDGGLSSISGGVVVTDANGNLIGAIAASGSFNPADDFAVATAGHSAIVSGATAASLVIAAGPTVDGYTAQAAAARADNVIAQATTLGTRQAVCFLDAFGNLKLFYRMDGSPLLAVDYACRKARTSLQFQARSEAVYAKIIPGAPFYTADSSNGQLAPYGGGFPLYTVDNVLAGAFGCSGSYNASVDAEACMAGGGSLSSASMASLSLQQALGAVQAGVNGAQLLPQYRYRSSSMGTLVTVAVVDAGGNLIAMYRGDGMPTSSANVAIKRARAGSLLGVPVSVVSGFVVPGAPAANIQLTNGGLIVNGGGSPLSVAGVRVGGVGVVLGNGNTTQENALVILAAGGVTTPVTMASLSLPALVPSQVSLYTYMGEAVTLRQLQAAAIAAITEATHRQSPIAFTGLDGTGALKLFVRMDGAQLGASDISQQIATSAFATQQGSNVPQGAMTPGSQLYTVQVGTEHVFVPGGIPLISTVAPVAVVGAIAASSGFMSATNDDLSVAAGLLAFVSAYEIDNPAFNPSAGAVGFAIAFAVIACVCTSLVIAVIRLRRRLEAKEASGMTGYQQFRQPLNSGSGVNA